MDSIVVATEPIDKVSKMVYKYMKNEPGIKEIYKNKMDRLTSSVLVSLILLNDEPIGFLNMVRENVDGVLFADMGIKQEYRGKGYGSKALKSLYNQGYKPQEYIIIETLTSNTLGNLSALSHAILIYEYDDKNYYLVDDGRYNEFINSIIYSKLIEYIKSDKPKQLSFVQRLMNDYN